MGLSLLVAVLLTICVAGEQLFVLQKSSTVNGIVYPVWDGPSQAQWVVTFSKLAKNSRVAL